MYTYTNFDKALVRQRVTEFRSQVARRLDGSLSEVEFKPLRLMNGLYLQLHAYMLRVAIPYGVLSSVQMRALADIADKYDRGYGHFTTRQNIQFNWPQLKDVPDMLDDLAAVEMHAIQTSGNCIRNVTTDAFAGVAADEIADPRPTAELLRQWSTFHPEFAFLPRKFKFAVSGSPADRAATLVHDIGIAMRRSDDGLPGYQVAVGGGQGRTPMVAKIIREFLPADELLGYMEALLRVYNRYGRRDNKYKARIKILVHEMGLEAFTAAVDAEYTRQPRPGIQPDKGLYARLEAAFAHPVDGDLTPDVAAADEAALSAQAAGNPGFAAWLDQNLMAHRFDGYSAVTISVKPTGGIPGDATSDQMRGMADLAERYSFSELRVTHRQNVVLPTVRRGDLFALWQGLVKLELAEANIGLLGDIIACPGLDYCALATARSIPIAQELSAKFADRQKDIGELAINISGCINACGHHHVANIGILGLEKSGEEFYQITLGGDSGPQAAVGRRVGPGFSAEEVPGAVEKIVDTYQALKQGDEQFMATLARVGDEPFKDALYA